MVLANYKKHVAAWHVPLAACKQYVAAWLVPLPERHLNVAKTQRIDADCQHIDYILNQYVA